jgi:hypothetical protein
MQHSTNPSNPAYQFGPDASVKLDFDPVRPLPRDTNTATEQIYSAVKTKGNPERLNPAFIPASFSRPAYLANPSEYLETHEPGRVFQSAQPGRGVPVIERIGSGSHVLKPGESVRLIVKTLPHMPASFTSFDLGAFSNGLSTITVAADENGLAVASFHAAPGEIMKHWLRLLAQDSRGFDHCGPARPYSCMISPQRS